ncbi:hypothetical protein V6R21_10530 [Limibacter armeniacum]|uniref:hypothetical protein n=1 Tax=Limibacter armeniacum TaxID=466084 RepID=UPI002FE52BEE
MMRRTTIYESDFSQVDFESENNLIITTYKPATALMSDEDYRKEIKNQLALMGNYKPEFALEDLRDLSFVLSIELQEWGRTYVRNALVEVGIRKTANIYSQKFFVHLSVETQAEGIKEPAISFFENEEKARRWLFEN